MATGSMTPEREAVPSSVPTPPSFLGQKRALEEDHTPNIPSRLNPEARMPKPQPGDDMASTPKVGRPSKKEGQKKRESKAGVGSGSAPDSARATPDPNPSDVPPEEVCPVRYKLAPPKQSDFEPPKGPVFTPHHVVTAPDKTTIEFCETSDHVYNKKSFHYSHCLADPSFPSLQFYRRTEPEPYDAHLSFEDAATHMFFDSSGTHITTDKGFRMARANVALREGRWYWECKITQGILNPVSPQTQQHQTSSRSRGDSASRGHVRMGFARRESPLDAPVGFNAYSYGIRDKEGHKVHMSRPKAFFPPNEEIREGDVIGLEIQLPSEQLQRKVLSGQYNPAVDLADEETTLSAEGPNIVRDRIPIRFKSHIYFEQIDYHATKELDDLMNPSPAAAPSGPVSKPPNPHHPIPALRTLPNSSIKIYKNGALMGTPFDNLLAFLPPASRPLAQVSSREGLDDGMLGYFPAVSVFRGGAAEVNFGPDFWYPPPDFEELEEVDIIMGVGGAEDDDVNGGRAAGIASSATLLTKLRPVSERFVEQIVEDIVYDIVDEVDFWLQDSGRTADRATKDEKVVSGGMAPGREEIKELVQDD